MPAPVQQPQSQSQSQYTAIVHAADGIRFVAASPRPDELAGQVVAYIRERCDHALWPSDARQVRELIDTRRPFAAIGMYFANVGDRWDAERLELGGLSFGPENAGDATPGGWEPLRLLEEERSQMTEH